MTNRRMAVSALAMGLVLSLAGNTPADQPQKRPRVDRAAALQLPITGTAAGGVTFAGTLSVQKFVVHEGQVAAVGFVRGTVSGAPLGTVLVGPIMLPVQVGPSTTLAPTTAVPVPLQATCPGLHIEIGATNLNVLGLLVATQPVALDISGDSAGVLGHLVCTILDTLNNVVGLVDLLNQLLGVLTGLLGGLVP